MLDEINYSPADARSLRDIVAEFISLRGTCRIKIMSGAPRCWYSRRPIRRVHCNMRYKNGSETFRSKNCTDAVLAMKVVRTEFDAEHGTLYAIVFAPYGRSRDIFADREHIEPKPVRSTDYGYMTIPDGIDDELPF